MDNLIWDIIPPHTTIQTSLKPQNRDFQPFPGSCENLVKKYFRSSEKLKFESVFFFIYGKIQTEGDILSTFFLLGFDQLKMTKI